MREDTPNLQRHNAGHHGVQRHCDVAVIGGSAAGLAAALELGRRGHSVIVVDAGDPAHAPVDDIREELRRHGGEVLVGQAEGVTRIDDDRFRVELTGGHSIVTRRVVTATALADPRQAEPEAMAAGRRAGTLISADLVQGDLDATRPSANEADWDHRYGGGSIWSGNPNGTLVNEVDGLAPGRALDVGAGEGADALWLAERGWRVTANDIARRALDRLMAEAEHRGLPIECNHGDANTHRAFETAAFDLVSAQYASIPRTPDNRAVHNLLDAVAPGGTLLIVSHDLEPLRAPVTPSSPTRPFDPDAYVRVEDFVAALAGSSDWDIEVHDKRPRPPGAASAGHHVDDIVFRARRLPVPNRHR